MIENDYGDRGWFLVFQKPTPTIYVPRQICNQHQECLTFSLHSMNLEKSRSEEIKYSTIRRIRT